MGPPAKRRRLSNDGGKPDTQALDAKLAASGRLPTAGGAKFLQADHKKRHSNKKLAAHLNDVAAHHRSTAKLSLEHDALLLPPDNAGLLEAEDELERTYKVGQDAIKASVGLGAARKGFELDLPTYGPYAVDYTANGRHLALAGRLGHVATFDWQAGKLHAELHLNETVRDVACVPSESCDELRLSARSWLHDQSFFAVAQKKYVYIYDKSGLEVHQLRHHIEVTRMQFLRYHFLLATVGNAGYLKYQDTSTGQMVGEAKTKLGACDAMAQNPHTGVVGLGHHNGTVTLWSPNMSQPHVKLLAHLGPVRDLAYDPASSGHYLATCGLDGRLKVWDDRTWACVNEWKTPTPAASLAFSQKGLLAVGWGPHVSVYRDATRALPEGRYPGPYLAAPFSGRAVHRVRFCPFDDVLGAGHARGFAHVLVPGAGEANYDSLEADPYETAKSRREREVASLLDKIQPDQITLDRDLIGKVARPDEARVHPDPKLLRGQGAGRQVPYARKSRLQRLEVDGAAETDAEAEAADVGQEQVDDKRREERKRRIKGGSKVAKRLQRRRQNVVDEALVIRREKLAARKEQQRQAKLEAEISTTGGALARFSRPVKRA